MEVEPLSDEGAYVAQGKESAQFETVLDYVEEDIQALTEQTSGAIQVTDPESGDAGVRVDVLYDAVLTDGEQASLDVHIFYPNDGEQETIGYLRQENELVTEYATDSDVMPDCAVTDGADILLEPRDGMNYPS